MACVISLLLGLTKYGSKLLLRRRLGCRLLGLGGLRGLGLPSISSLRFHTQYAKFLHSSTPSEYASTVLVVKTRETAQPFKHLVRTIEFRCNIL